MQVFTDRIPPYEENTEILYTGEYGSVKTCILPYFVQWYLGIYDILWNWMLLEKTAVWWYFRTRTEEAYFDLKVFQSVILLKDGKGNLLHYKSPNKKGLKLSK